MISMEIEASPRPVPLGDTAPAPDTLLATKLFAPPPRRHLVRRPRLTERLCAGARGPLTLIVAPAGWGKSTLLSDWLAAPSANAPAVAWLALDEGDNDLNRFLRYVIAALQGAQLRVGGDALAMLRSPHALPAEAVLTLLLNDLTALTQDVVLVLDDYHLINAAAVHRTLAFLLDHLPLQVHLVIATRTEPPLPLARLRARGYLTELRTADLRFTRDEAADFLRHTMGLELTADYVARLDACTEGWIAGLHLAGLFLRDHDDEEQDALVASFQRSNRYILDYLADEVFDRQPLEIQRFLLHTSILDRLTGSLCDAVAGSALDTSMGSQALLERLEADNLFVIPLDGDGVWYRYHHLFGAFLRRRLQRDHPEMTSELHARACAWLEGHGLPAYAAEHALAAPDYEAAARLIEGMIGSTIWRRGELTTLQRWLDRLPPAKVRVRPRLALDLAWVALWSGRVETAQSRLQDVDEALTDGTGVKLARAVAAAMNGEVAAIRAELARQQGETAAAIRLANQALDALPEANLEVRGATLGLLGQAHLVAGDVAAARRAFVQAVDLGLASGSMPLTLAAGGRLIQAQVASGRLREADAVYRRMLRLAESWKMTESPAAGVAQIGMGEVLRQWNDLEGAEDLLRRGITLCVQWGSLVDTAVDGYLSLARVLLARGDVAGAEEAILLAEIAGREDNSGPAQGQADDTRVAVARIDLRLRTGELEPVMRWLAVREETLNTPDPTDYFGTLERLAVARLSLTQRRYDEALRPLSGLLHAVEGKGWTAAVIEILLLQALSYAGGGQTAQAMLALSRALSLAEPEGYIRLFADEGVPMAALLRQASSRGLGGVYVKSLLVACGEGAGPLPQTQTLIDPLSARELELLTLLAAGLSTSEAADQLFITTGTVRNHLKSVYGKLDVHSRLQAVQRAQALNLLAP